MSCVLFGVALLLALGLGLLSCSRVPLQRSEPAVAEVPLTELPTDQPQHAANPQPTEPSAPGEQSAAAEPTGQPDASDAQHEAPPGEDGDDVGWIDVFAHVRVHRQRSMVEFTGFAPINAHDPRTPVVELEVVACARGSKEHESIVATDALASNIHAALLMIGAEPGRPGSFVDDGQSIRPVGPLGDELRVLIAGPQGRWYPAGDMIVHKRTGRTLTEAGLARWRFGGSREVHLQGRGWYEADGTGLIVGLATFGSEAIALEHVFSHESAVHEPVWIVRNELMPSFGDPMRVRLQLAPTNNDG